MTIEKFAKKPLPASLVWSKGLERFCVVKRRQ